MSDSDHTQHALPTDDDDYGHHQLRLRQLGWRVQTATEAMVRRCRAADDKAAIEGIHKRFRNGLQIEMVSICVLGVWSLL